MSELDDWTSGPGPSEVSLELKRRRPISVDLCPALNGGRQCQLAPLHGGKHNYEEPVKVIHGVKHDGGKLRWHLLPAGATEELVKVLDHGATKYGEFNWQQVLASSGGPERYLSAALRHIWAWNRGQRLDPDTGLHHLAHAACSLLFITNEELFDERPEGT